MSVKKLIPFLVKLEEIETFLCGNNVTVNKFKKNKILKLNFSRFSELDSHFKQYIIQLK